MNDILFDKRNAIVSVFRVGLCLMRHCLYDPSIQEQFCVGCLYQGGIVKGWGGESTLTLLPMCPLVFGQVGRRGCDRP